MTETSPVRPSSTGVRIFRVLLGTVRQISEGNVALTSAGVAFFSMLSLFPALAALIAVLALILDPAFVVAQLEDVKGLLPTDVYDIVNAQIVSLVSASSDTLGRAGLISLLLALWSARAGVGAMITGLNEVYGERNRQTVKHYLRAVALTVALVGVGILSLISLVVIPVVLAFFPLGILGTVLIEGLRWIVAVVVLLTGIGLLYRYGPNRPRASFRWLSVGALVAAVLWVVVSVAFSFYVSNFGNYNQVYGSIGAVVAMLVWMWLTSFVVLFGATLNAQLERESRLNDSAERSMTDEARS